MAEKKSIKATLGWLAGWAIGLAVFFGFSILGLYVAFRASEALVSWQRVQNWQPVAARIEKLELRKFPKVSPGAYAMEVAARYRYQFGDKTYTSDQVGAYEGSREVDAWHETTYEHLRQASRRSGKNKNGEVTAWVDPARPDNAVLDRTLRWVVPLVLFPVAAFLLGAAALMGYGMRLHAQRRRDAPPSSVERQPADPDWAEVPEWRKGVVSSDAVGGVALAWLFTFMAGLSTWGSAIGSYHHGRISLLGAAALLVFGALASWLLILAVRKTLRFFRQGQTYLHLMPFPARLGRELRGIVNLTGASGDGDIKVSLSCTRRNYGDDNSPSHTAVWENTTRTQLQMAPGGSTVRFKFALPDHLPASAWLGRSTRPSQGVDWMVHIESPDARIDRAFSIPVLADRSSAPTRAASPAGAARSWGDIPDLISVLKSMREKKSQNLSTTVNDLRPPEAKPSLSLAEPYVRRNGTELKLDTLLLPKMARMRWGGLAFLLMSMGSAVMPLLWLNSARWSGKFFEIVLTVGIGLVILIPALLVPVLAWLGIQRLSRRIRVTIDRDQVIVFDQNWVWSKILRFETSIVAGIRSKNSGDEVGSRGIVRYYDIVATLDNGREVELAWGVRDTDVAQALAATIQNACGSPRRGPISKVQSRIELRRRPANALVLVCLLTALAPLAIQRSLQLPQGDAYDDDALRLEHLIAQFTEPGYFHQWLVKEDTIHIPPQCLLRRWITETRDRLAARRKPPAGVEIRAVPLDSEQVAIDGTIGEAEWQDALVLALQPEALGSKLSMRSDGARLLFAVDVPGDTTARGFDQFRVSFHVGLAPSMSSERVHVGTNGHISVIRDFISTQAADGRTSARHYSDGITYELAKAASTVDGHRRYELAVDLREAGIVRGAPFTLWAEIEGDPQYHPSGRFKSRTSLGDTGDFRQPLWLQIPR